MGAVIGYGNLIDTATISTSGAWSGTYPANNVKNRFLGVFARDTGGSGQIYIDLLSAKEIGVIGIAGCALTSGVTIQVRASPNNWSTVYTIVPTEAFSDYGVGGSWFATFSPQTYRYWNIVFTGAGNNDVGRVFMGPRFRPGYGLSFGAGLGLEDRTTRSESSGGARFHRAKTPRRILTGEFESLTDAEAAAWRSIMRTYGSHSEYVLIWDDADTSNKRVDRNMLCNIDELSDVEFPNAAQRKVGMKLSEIIA